MTEENTAFSAVVAETPAPAATPDPKAEPAPKTEEAKPSDDEAASEAARTLSRHKQTAKERVQQAVARQREAERQSAAKDRYIQELEGRLAKVPDPSKYDDNAEYTADMLEHRMDKRELDRAKQEKQGAESAQREALAEAWTARVTDFKETAKDFEAVAYSAPISEATALLIAEMEEGPAVAYELGKNHAEARKLDRMTERQKAIELGKIAARISAPVPIKTTLAPAPIDPVRGRGDTGSKSLEDLSMAEYAALVAKETRR